MKYSTISGVTRYSGGTIVLGRGDSFADDHPLVLARPDIFTDEQPGPKHGSYAPSVERATRAPGEKRAAVSKPGDKKPGAKKMTPAQIQAAQLAAAQAEQTQTPQEPDAAAQTSGEQE